jgi:hypothetical protein
MRQLQRFGLVAVMGAALVALTLATPASARKFQMSGSWFVRNGQVFIPLQFAAAGMNGTKVLHASKGNLTGAFFFPNGVVPGLGGVSANGMSPATLMIPKHRFVQDVMAAIPLNGITLVQITTNFGVDAPFQAATLAKSGGPGSFTWCPGNALCLAGTGMLAGDPPNGGTRNGRIIYNAGANKFGGALQMGLKRGGDNVFKFNAAPMQAGHNIFGSAPGTRNLAPGAGSADNPTTEMVFLKRGVVTQPTMAPAPNNLILFPGPKLTVGLGLSNTMTGMIFYLPQLGTGPMGTQAGQITSNFGFSHTTGTVIGQQTVGTGGQDFFTFKGSDMRTALGAGNIQSVAGGISFRNTLAGQTPYISMHKINITMAAPIPSMSPAGFAAAGALMLLAVGYVLRRRLS